jgi:hypothetical protein
MVVFADQRIEDQFINAFRLRVFADARVKVRRTAFNKHDQRVRIRPLGAGNQARAQQQQKNF